MIKAQFYKTISEAKNWTDQVPNNFDRNSKSFRKWIRSVKFQNWTDEWNNPDENIETEINDFMQSHLWREYPKTTNLRTNMQGKKRNKIGKYVLNAFWHWIERLSRTESHAVLEMVSYDLNFSFFHSERLTEAQNGDQRIKKLNRLRNTFYCLEQPIKIVDNVTIKWCKSLFKFQCKKTTQIKC